MSAEYPKALYLRGWDDLAACVTVQDAEGEAEAREAGYRGLADAEPDADGHDNAGAAKRGRPRKAD